jgi:hypothetical protein
MSFFWGNSLPITPGVDVYSVAPPAPPITLPAHPRIWMNPARVTYTKLQKTNNTANWINVKKIADAQVAKGTAYTFNIDDQQAPYLGLAYIATGNQAYATRAEVVLTNGVSAAWQNFCASGSCYQYRFAYIFPALTLDWCYAGLSIACRQLVAKGLMDAADFCWKETNPTTPAYGQNDASSNYNWGETMTALGALSASGDDPTISGTVSSPNRPAYHIALMLSKWNSNFLAKLNQVGYMKGGGWGEGSNYDSSWYVARFIDAFATCGVSLPTPFIDEALAYRMNIVMPGYIYKAPFGDQPLHSNASFYEYDRVSSLHLMTLSSNATLKSQMQFLLNKAKQIPIGENGTGKLAEEFLFDDPSQSVATDLSGLPLYKLSEGPGFYVYRNSFTDLNTTAFTFESGIIGSGHGGLNCGGLRIWKGSFWVSADANIYSASGIRKETQYFNNMTLAGANQPLNGQNIYPIPTIQTPTSTLVVVRQQSKTAYGLPASRTLTESFRTVAYLPTKDTFIIIDKETAVNSASAKVFRWQMKNSPPSPVGLTFKLSSQSGDYNAYGQILTPLTSTLAIEGQNPNGTGVTSFVITNTLPTGNATDIVVTTLQLSSAIAAPYVVSITDDGTSYSIHVDDKVVTVNHVDDTQPVTIT